MSDLTRFVDAIQHLRLAMMAVQMGDVDSVSIRLSTSDGFRLEHMLRQSGQLTSVAEAKEPLGFSRHVMVANIKIWWFAPDVIDRQSLPPKPATYPV